ncbi:unnamed protein product [Blepharisma stoltei]|uniref:Uncharacterized protein n=1 Tax=Blepharisma stoltei TaxID=1481888 RepID=A0AAU9K334_9CILI|nr:unnamed protein product [Blepharisma stoltei]
MEHKIRLDITAKNSGYFPYDFINQSCNGNNNPNPNFSSSHPEFMHAPISQGLIQIVYEKPPQSYGKNIEPENPNIEFTIPNIPFLCRSKSGSKWAQKLIVNSLPEQIDWSLMSFLHI